ncbi:MAG: type IV pilus secretin PilQ [Magnetococcus sp. DMHC-8]
MGQPRPKNNRITSSLLAGTLLLGGAVGLGGCLLMPASATGPANGQGGTIITTDSGTAVTAEPPADPTTTVAAATLLSRIDALETSQGVRILLEANGSLSYQVFALDSPPRLLLTLAGVRLEPAVQPRQLALPGVTGLFPMAGDNQTSRLEIALLKPVEYTIRERPNGLELTLFSRTEAPAVADEAPPGQPSPGAPGNRIDNLQVSHSHTGTLLHLFGAGTIPEPESFRLQEPPRLVLDFAGVTGPTTDRVVPVASREVNTVRLAAEPHKTRLIIELADPNAVMRLDRTEPMPVIQLLPAIATAPVVQHTPQVEAVTFTQKGSTALLTIRTNDAAVLLDSHREGQQLTITLPGTRLAEGLSHRGTGGQRQDVQSFGGPVKSIDTYPDGPNTRVVVTLTAPGDQHEIVQQGKNILLQVRPAATAETGPAQPVYTGAKVSMDFKGIDIHNALRLLAELNRLNLLISDTVKGTVTMRLVEVPWDQALDLILETKGLGKILQGNVLRVAPIAELQSLADAQWQARESKQKLEPIVTELIPVSFAKAAEIRDLLMEADQKNPGSTPAAGASAGAARPNPAGAAAQGGREAARAPRLLSASGSVSVDQRTNTLIVKDMAANLAKIREMVAKLDKPIPQVLIEARIVEVGRDSATGLGINWGFNYKSGTDAALGIANSAGNAYQVQQDLTTQSARRALMTGSATPAFNVGMLPGVGQMPSWVGSGVPSNLGIHLGALSPLLDLDIELGALEVNGKAKTISSPRVLTANNKEANISQGIRQPYPAESQSGGIIYQYIDAALSLKVTPHVTASGYITLEVTAKNNSIKGAVAPGAPPALDTREVETQALVRDGQTIVLGGILQNRESDSQRGIPELQEIPLLGWLFKNKVTSNNQTELLVFITPRIVDHSDQARQ